MTKLSVNINKIAVVRNSRGGNMPDVVRAALDIERFGADGITVRTGRLDAEGMPALLRGAALCVDATHPYATEATRNIRAAAAAAGWTCWDSS